MEQEDYLKRQIDQLGRVLGTILADLLGFRAKGQIGEGIEATDQALKRGLDLNINDLISIPPEKFIQRLQEVKKLSNDSFDKLADILFLLAEEPARQDIDNERRKQLYESARVIYEHLDKTSPTYSFDRHYKIEKIKNAFQ